MCRCNNLAQFFSSKVQNILKSFPVKDNVFITNTIDSSRAENAPLLEVFNSLTLESFLPILASVKSGSPLDPAPLNILKKAVSIVAPFILSVINSYFTPLSGKEPWSKH